MNKLISDKNKISQFDRLAPTVTDNRSFFNPYLFVNWNMGNICTYKCSYCSKDLYDGSFPWPNLEEAVKTVKILNQVYRKPPYNKKKIIFELLGGEVTLWKDLDKLLSVLKEEDNIILIITNGVRHLNWWAKNGRKFNRVTLSYHPEFGNYKHMCDVSNLLADLDIVTSILVLMYPKLWEKCVEAHKYFKANSKATICLQRLHLILTSKDGGILKKKDKGISEYGKYSYNKEQLTYLSENEEIEGFVKYRYDLGISFFDSKNQKQPVKVTPSFLSINGLNNWKNWKCYIGVDSLFLEQNGDVRRGVMCRVEPPMGKWRAFKPPEDEAWSENIDEIKWPTEPVICPYSTCFCGADYKTRKTREKFG